LTDGKFHENWYSENHTPLKSKNGIFLVFYALLVTFEQNLIEESSSQFTELWSLFRESYTFWIAGCALCVYCQPEWNKTAEHFRFLLKSALGKPKFLIRINEISFTPVPRKIKIWNLEDAWVLPRKWLHHWVLCHGVHHL